MTEVPEYLLERSRARRAALGLATEGAPASSTSSSDAPPTAPATPAAAGPAEGPAPTPAPTAASAPSATRAQVEAAPAPYVRPPVRSGVPVWMMPVLAVLPLWAVVYLGGFGTKGQANLSPVQRGAQVYQTAGCSGCHGPRGEGAVGPKLAGGEAKLTFPNEADHIAWVESGSASKKGQPYGDANRPGGQHMAKSGGMPSFKGQLSDDQIKAVVTYERDAL